MRRQLLFLLLSFSFLTGCNKESNNTQTYDSAQYQEQLKQYEEQVQFAQMQMEETRKQMKETQWQMQENRRQLEESARQQKAMIDINKRYAALLKIWEEQAKRNDKILDIQEKNLNIK